MAALDLQWFSAEDEGKTEEPSETKLRKAREEEGRLPKSQELNSTLVFLFCALLLIALSPWIEHKIEEMMIFYFQNATQSQIDDRKFAYAFIRYLTLIVLPFVSVGAIAGIVGNIVQNKGFLYAPKIIQPKFNKIVPHFGQYFKRTIFSREGLLNIAKSIIKVVIIAIVAFVLIRSNLETLLEMLHTGGAALAMRGIGRIVAQLLIISSIILLFFGVLDYFLIQKPQFMESMKMTKQEVKQEFKEMEGDPEVKSRLDSAQREMLEKNIPKAIKEADVLITNPTHFAVALQWKREVAEVPQITAKGEDFLAQTMKRLARENDVPIVEDRPLARTLYNDTNVGDLIPDNCIRSIVTVYQQIHYMEKKNKKK